MTPNSFEVAFCFDGGLADEGVLDGSDHEAATRASRRLLALHAHCILHSRVPSAAQSEGHGYHVRHVATRRGSHLDVWNVVISNAWTIQIVGGLLGAAYASEVKAGINAAALFLRDSLRAAVGMGPKNLPRFPRIEPILEARGGNRDPMFDIDSEDDAVRLRLREVTIQVLHDVARPVGRSARNLTILIEGEPIAVIDEQMKRQLLADQISTAVAVLKAERQGRADLRL
jgi:hypothetical protein